MVRQIVPLLVLVSIVLAIDTQSMLTVLQEEQALPRTVKPYLYLLDLHPRISEGYFNGSVDIHIQCLEPTRVIVLHASYELQLENINLTAISTDYDYDVPAITEVARNGSTDTLNITLEEELTEGRVYRLHLEFHGLLKNNDYMYTSPSARGFFRDMYTDRETRETRWFAWTSTFPGFARHLFPCFDEPSFRAEFTVGVSHLTNMTVLTGWPSLLNKSTGEQGYVMEYFSRTYCIAPYSVGVLVAELDATEAMNVTSSQGTVELAVHHVRDNYESKVTELVPKVLQFLQDYLQARFPVDKLDIVAMPHTYFEMERDFPGLIMLSYFKFGDRDEDLYKDLVRQWLRHMVTLETWSAFNINELLTTYLTRYALSKTSNKQPELTGESRLTMYDQFATNIEDPSYFGYIPPYTTERVPYGRPVQVSSSHDAPWVRRSCIQPQRETASLWFMEMLNNSLGGDTFRKALGSYFRDNMNTTVTKDTLWSVMKQQALEDGTLPSNVSLQQVADSWLVPDCLRYPVLTVTRNYDDRSASLEQHVFSTDLPRSLTADVEALLWWLPVEYISPGTTVPHLAAWMGTRHLEIAGLPEVYEYIVINPTDAGMFLVNYDPHNWNLLKRDFSQLPVRTRAKLMNDVLLLVRGGEQDYVLALNLTLNLFDETDCSVWTPLFKHLSNIEPLYSFTPVEEKLNAYLRLLLTHRFDAMVQPDFESDNDYRNCWNQAKEQLYKLGYQPHVDKARERLQEIMPIFLVNDTNSGMIVFCPEFMRNDSEDWLARNTELHYFLDSQRETKPFLERSLAKCPGYSSLVERVLNQTLDDNTVLTTTDWYGILNFISSSSEAQNISLEFFFENYNQLKYKFYFMEEYWKSLVTRVTDNIRTEETLSKLNQLCKEHEGKLGYTQSVFEEAIKKATKTIEWCRSNLPDINIWLEDVLPRAGVM